MLENITSAGIRKYGVDIPAHGVTICVYGGEDKDIAEAVYNKKSNGAATGGNKEITHIAKDYHNAVYQYKILRPSEVPFFIKLTLDSNTSLSSKQLYGLKEALFSDFYGRNPVSGNTRISLASTVYASRFYIPALAVAGVNNIHHIEIALGKNGASTATYTDMLQINGNEEPVLNMDNIIILDS